MNRILSAVIFFMALSGLTACSSDNDNNDGGTPSATGGPTTGGSGTTGDGSAGSGSAGGSGNTGSGNGTQPTDGSGANGPDGTGTGGAGAGGTNTGSSGGGGGAGIGGGVVGDSGGGTSAGSGGSGNGGGAGGGSTSVSAQNISNAPASNAEIATDANGNALAVWQQHDGTRNNIYYSRFTGGSWSAPALLENLDGDTTKPDVAMNSAGNAIAVWTQPSPGSTGSPSANWTWARVFSPSTGWGAPVIVSTYTDNGPPNRDNAIAAIDDSGTAIALWEEFSDRTCGGASLVASVFRVGSGWSDDRVLHCGWSQRADIAMDGNGNAIVGYMHDGGGDGEAARAVHYTNGVWSAPVILTPLPPTRSMDGGIRVAMNAAGEALAVWSHMEILPDNLVYSLSVSRYRGGVWTREHWEWGYAPSVAMASNGNITVTWHQDDGGIYARRLEAGAWLSPVRVGVGTNARAVAPGAGPVMVWMQGDDLMFSHYLGGNVWQSPQTAESNAEPVSAPRLAASTHANAFVAWLQPSGVWARRLP